MSLLKLRIVKIKKETADTKSFYLQPIQPDTSVPYKPGQFLTLVFSQNEKEIRRSYSFGSTPELDPHFFITVKRKANGAISRLLDDHYREGDELLSLMPSGKFTLEHPVSSSYVFIAAGSGITPIFSLIKELLYHTHCKVLLINQCRNEKNIIYKDTIKQLETDFETRFEWIQLFSDPASSECYSRRLNIEILEKIIKTSIPENEAARFYLCGPTTFMRMAQFTLKWMGFDEDQIKKEIFVVEPPSYIPLIADTSLKKVKLQYQQKKHAFSVAYPDTILNTALKLGIELPYSCKAGSCSTCMAKCIKGEVVMSANEVLTEKDLNNGLVLTCVGYAATDIELDFDIK